MYRKKIAWTDVVGPLLLSAIVACNDESGADDHQDVGDGGHAHVEESGAGEEVPCTDDYPSFRPDLSFPAGGLTVRLLAIDPQPPRQRMKNDWTIEIVGEDGSPVTDAQITGPDSYMVFHQHYGRTAPKVQQLPEPGRFVLDDIDFRMPGPWQVRFRMQRPASSQELVVLQLCVE